MYQDMGDNSAVKVLVVDDEQEALFFIGKMLQRAGYSVVTTAKGREALSIAKRELPDVIILDIMMPDISGGEIVSLLAKEHTTSNIPIIYLSAVLTKEEESLVGKSGKHYVLAKPATEKELIGMVESVVSGK